MRVEALILALVLTAAPASARSMFVWRPAAAMTDGKIENGVTDYEAQKRLLRFCAAPGVGITRLYFLVVPESVDPGSLATFLRQAGEAGVEIYAVPRGSIQDEWIKPVRKNHPADHDKLLTWAEKIAGYNRIDPDAGFAGLQLDVEPHLAAPEGRKTLWKKKRRGLGDSRTNKRIAREYLDLLDEMRRFLDDGSGSMKLAVAIPAWYDGNDRPSSFQLSAGGKRKSWAAHIQDRVDFVSLMDYSDARDREERKRLIRNVTGEVAYGPAEVLLETSRLGRKNKGNTLYQEGEKALLQLERFIAKKLRKHPGFMGTGVHHYLSAYGSGSRKWPAHE